MIEYIDLTIDFAKRNDRLNGITLDRVTTRSYDTAIKFRIEIIGHTLDDTYDVKILTKYHKSGLSVMTTLGERLEIADGKLIYTPKVNLITEADYVRNYLYLSKDGLGLDMAQFNYEVDVSQIGEVAVEVRQVYDESYETLLAEFEQALEDYKLTLPQASELRAEIDVILNQFSVDSQQAIGYLGEVSAAVEIAEASRVQAETERKEAEILREESYEAKVDTAIVEADVVEKVDNKVTELTPRMNELTAQLAQTHQQKADKTHIWPMANMGQDVKEAMTGGSVAVVGRYSVGEENIIKSAVRPEHTSFLNIGKNLFNKKDVTPSRTINVLNGNVETSDLHDLSGLISVFPNTVYSRKFSRVVAYYTAERTFISGVASSGLSFTTPVNCHYIRVTTEAANNRKEEEQIEIGSASTNYEEHVMYLGDEQNKVVLKNENFTDKIINDRMLGFNAVKVIHADFIKQLPNLINKQTIKYSAFFNRGSYLENNFFDSTEYIPVRKGTYTFSKGARLVTFMDANRNWVTDFLNNGNFENTPFTFTVPSDGYIVGSFFKASTQEIVLNEGVTADIDKNEYGFVLDQEKVTNVPDLLSASEIEKTNKRIVFSINGDVERVVFAHKETLEIIREDTFAYEENKITETRKLYNGSRRTIIYNLDTLETEVL